MFESEPSEADPVNVLAGIGKVTAGALNKHGIHTVGELAKVLPGAFDIPKLKTHIQRAKDYIAQIKPEKKSSPNSPNSPRITVGGDTETQEQQGTKESKTLETLETSEKLDQEVEKKQDQEKQELESYLISDHTWFEIEVVVPIHKELKRCIVFELSIEPHERITFLCTWVDLDQDNNEVMTTMSYSPQLILHFNLFLPPLRVSIRPTDFDQLPNKHSFINMLWEVNTMQRYIESD